MTEDNDDRIMGRPLPKVLVRKKSVNIPKIWRRTIAQHMKLIEYGHRSGEWVTPQYTGYKPIRIDEHGSIIKPHHS
jgi:hypothetical protein